MTAVTAASPSIFVLDANVFIEAAKGYYAFDLAPKFWNGLLANGTAGRICTVDRIAAEVMSPTPVKDWINTQFMPCVKASTGPDTLIHYAALMRWANAEPFTIAAKSEFATVADAWLVAYSRAVGGIVVTHEAFDANCKRRVKIPNACQHLGVQYINTFDMLRTLGMTIG
ncbi:MAG TPA: DUF4411 family protein [Phycisphaerae bacterium]|nr:DUF4411 family protein [Phycisphaerae bacterium]